MPSDDAQRRHVLIIEDESSLAEEITAELSGLGYCARSVESVAEGLRHARSGEPAILIVDRMLGGADGLSIIETLRQEGFKTPVLVISALSAVDERIKGLKAGGDDYLVKPFAMAELTARIEALLRRVDDTRASKLRAGDLEMDLIEQTVRRGDTEIELLPREFKLLEFFLRRPGANCHAHDVAGRRMALPLQPQHERRRRSHRQFAPQNRCPRPPVPHHEHSRRRVHAQCGFLRLFIPRRFE